MQCLIAQQFASLLVLCVCLSQTRSSAQHRTYLYTAASSSRTALLSCRSVPQFCNVCTAVLYCHVRCICAGA
jgi:hypothetical protein